MAEEGFDNSKETSGPDEDYGLPNIEIKPIQKASTAPAARTAEGTTKSDPPASKEAGAPPRAAVEDTGKSYSWAVMLLILACILAGGWFYYDYSSKGKPEAEQKEALVEEQVTAPAPAVEEVAEAPVEEVVTFGLTEIQSKMDRPRYFLVVASFIDEDLAKDRAEELHAKQMNTFLVYPYGDIAYYRLAIGQFESFALAAEEIDKVKDGFKENLWVLKY